MTITSEKPNPQPLTADHSTHLHSASANQLTAAWLQRALRYLSCSPNKEDAFTYLDVKSSRFESSARPLNTLHCMEAASLVNGVMATASEGQWSDLRV